MSSINSTSDHEGYKGDTPEPDQVGTVTQTQGTRRNPIHYTDTQIVAVICATATINPFAAPHGKQTDVTRKGLQDEIAWLLNSFEKPRKTKFGEM